MGLANIEVVLHDIDESKFTRIQGNLSKQLGINISGDSGRESLDGFTVGWNKQNTDVTLTCFNKPLFVPAGLVKRTLEDLANE